MNTLFKAFIANPQNVNFDGEDYDEEILYVLRRSFITNLGWLFITAVLIVTPSILGPLLVKMLFAGANPFPLQFGVVLALFWYLFTFGFFLQNFLNWFFNVYIISNKRIVDMDFYGIVHKRISESPLRNIEDVTSKISGVFGVMFNVGDVFIQTAAEQTEFEFSDLDNPSKIRDILSDLVTALKTP